MTRSRSRSPRRERRRSTSRERERRRRERHRSHSRSPKRHRRSRSRSPRRRRSISPRRRSRSRSVEIIEIDKPETSQNVPVERKELDKETLQGLTDEDQEMYKIMGFVNFDTTKGKKTDSSTNMSDSQILEKRKYRQYMNRRGGFNRPLDFIA
ncbi:U4/U6.U5 small nuclear ribonucleoprotein 27 kDa protein [Holothuria leucospilota]|uniref:U4/U6.U5 small nuclear ribonucleoprotein 27 kDa protein n=1 Tax=Holothuria leucospilota TaxID=206669 RepID=A0A9Q0YRW6_HOLLE|nr:U4/U6.U5 small nuclear ribonucleoprotein 27 kDa protein [Holothuria leucospilota]